MSYGFPRPPSVASDRPTSMLDRPPSAAGTRRPSSRLSVTSASGAIAGNRPRSRAGAQTPVKSYAGGASTPAQERPSSRFGSAYATIHGTPRSHRPKTSISEWRRTAAESEDSVLTSSPTRPSTSDNPAAMFSPSGTLKRQTSALPQSKIGGRRSSVGVGGQGVGDFNGAMKPPPPRRKMSDVGETY